MTYLLLCDIIRVQRKESEVTIVLDLQTLHRSSLDNKFHATDLQTDKDIVIDEMFPIEYWDCPEAFKFANIRGYEHMTAKELETEEQQDEKLKDSEYYIEEKFDGTRALVYFLSQPTEADTEVGFCRVFSRRVSKKTGFYAENTDSLPQIREIDRPELSGTILDGEMFIDGLPFKEVSSLLKLMSIELVMPSNYLILCHPLLLPPYLSQHQGLFK